MQQLEVDLSCPECARRYVDAGDELACPSCGRTEEKEAVQEAADCGTSNLLTSRLALGSYMGSRRATREERGSTGVAGNGSRYEYLKAVSDFAGRSEGAAGACARLVDRIGEKLLIPRVACLEAASISRKVLSVPHPHRRVTVAAVSAYSLMAACKLEGVTSVSVREIIGAHVALGRQVTSASIIQLALESPIKTFSRSPEEYLPTVVARVSMNERLQRQLAREGVGQTAFANSLRETAAELLRGVGEEMRAGRRPSALAGAAVYSAELVLSRCESRRKRLTQRDLAVCGDSAEYTIREQCARVFAPVVDELVKRRPQSLLLPETR